MKQIVTYLMFFTFLSCQREKVEVYSIDHYYQIKLEDLRKERLKKCKEKAIVDADAHVDKLIDQWVNKQVFDSLEFPSKPIKPIRPEDIIQN